MALKSTIFKAELQVADLDRAHYADYSLTLAKHPSETEERLMVRLLAYALNAAEGLEFGKGLSDSDEPDLWRRDLTGACQQWLEVGLPDERRILKALGRASEVVVYAYGGHAARVWWQGMSGRVTRSRQLRVVHLPQEAVRSLGELARRSMRVQMMVQEGRVMVTSEDGMLEIEPEVWLDETGTR